MTDQSTNPPTPLFSFKPNLKHLTSTSQTHLLANHLHLSLSTNTIAFKMADTSKLTDCKTKSTMVSVDEALQIALSVAQRLPPVTVPLLDALGKVLAEDLGFGVWVLVAMVVYVSMVLVD